MFVAGLSRLQRSWKFIVYSVQATSIALSSNISATDTNGWTKLQRIAKKNYKHTPSMRVGYTLFCGYVSFMENVKRTAIIVG